MGKPPKQRCKLPSGNVRIQIYDYTDLNGKKHYKSFTAPTRREAKQKAEQWRLTKDEERKDLEDITVNEMVNRYIKIKEPVLSPSTVNGYLSLEKNYFRIGLGEKRRSELDQESIQLWISNLTNQGLSSKTINNAKGLLDPALEMFAPSFHYKATLPAKVKANLYCPNDENISRLIEYCKNKKELKIAVLLGAFGPLRRSEICALTDKDIHGNTITVNKALVRSKDGGWVIKMSPKSEGGYREITMPDFVINQIRGIQGRIVKATPDQISNRFKRAIKYSGLPHFRLHDLRHYSASIMHAIGVPDQYILERGGWSSDQVMKTVYRNTIDTVRATQTNIINAHFGKVSHEVSHEAQKARIYNK